MAKPHSPLRNGPWADRERLHANWFVLLFIAALFSHPAYPLSVWALADLRPHLGGGAGLDESMEAAAPAAFQRGKGPASDAARIDALSAFLSRRYQVAEEATRQLVSAAFRAGRELQLDPLLILAVMAVESRFNPIAESVAGAKGLMQIIPRYHLDKLESRGGEQAVLQPEINIRVGAEILREYFERTGDLTEALKLYNGSSWDEANRYPTRVLTEKQRLQRVVAQVKA
jgi:soluble lytic murein transglycosylase-like protein